MKVKDLKKVINTLDDDVQIACIMLNSAYPKSAIVLELIDAQVLILTDDPKGFKDTLAEGVKVGFEVEKRDLC